MFDVVDFLERVGRDATLAHASPDEVASGTLDARLSAEQRELLATRALLEVSALLDAPMLCCMQFPAEEEEEAPQPDEPDTEELPSDGG
ncbi:hypothetical protein [Fulvimonas yonginensis]|uniref:Transcriptional regulator n=1 Tax=Fulvimonas yonginensis TaxID=1495200 RepID=A0ABU8JC63_9GAMM